MTSCPECLSDNIVETEFQEMDEDGGWSKFKCHNCGCEWQESTEITITVFEHGSSYVKEKEE